MPTGFLLGLLSDLKDGDDAFLWNVKLSPNHVVLQHRRQYSVFKLRLKWNNAYTKILWHDAWKPEYWRQRKTSIARQRLGNRVSITTNSNEYIFA
jgi:hypothetical protein